MQERGQVPVQNPGGINISLSDILLGKGPKTLHGVKKMHRSKDVRGLVLALGIAPPNVIPYILDYLDDIEGVGFYPAMMEAGLPGMFTRIMEEHGPTTRRKAIKLIVKLVAWEKGREFLSERNTTQMVRMLHGADHDLRCWITYCLPEAISYGHGPLISIEGGIPAMVDHLDSDDPSLVSYSILALDGMMKAGYHDDLVRCGLSEKLLRWKGDSDPYVRTYAENLYLDLTTWKDRSSRIGNVIKKRDKDVTVIRREKMVNKKEEKLEDHSGDKSYVRPKARAFSKKKKNVLTSHGRISSEDDEEEVVELPSRSTRSLQERLKKSPDDEENDDFEITIE